MNDRDDCYAESDLTAAELSAARRFATEKPSPSYLQRKMNVPYWHAVRLMEFLEAEGTVWPRKGSRAYLTSRKNGG
jgi:DNA segregation ATPase FtsK/SpoIIIE-like protein